jgi:pantoate--beta-alanine ligase
MKIIGPIREMQVFSESARNSGQKISFVPTMGYFHDGHLSLMREGRQRADCLAISICICLRGIGGDFSDCADRACSLGA